MTAAGGMFRPRALDRLRHELRTPLNHVIGYSEMLLEDLDEGGSGSDVLRPALQRIDADARRLVGCVDRFFEALPDDARSVSLEALAASTAPLFAGMRAALDGLLREPPPADGRPPSVDDDLRRIALAVGTLQALLLRADGSPGSTPAAADAVPPAAPTGRPIDALLTGSILVVDDDADNRQMLARRLTRDGHRVAQAASGAEALARLADGDIELLLLDVMMPGLDGYGVLQRLKADEALNDVPVLMISALDETASVARCLELGADDYLPKPFDPVILRARIGACLERKHLRDREKQHLHELAHWNLTLEQRVAEQVAMVERLGRLKRFFSPQLAELILAGGADDPLLTHRREITVCFLDLRGFTAFAEDSEPEDVMAVLRQFHSEMGRLVTEHEGTLERFTGDGMMVFFNDPVRVADPAARAVRMALAMQDAVTLLAGQWRRMGFELDLGVGVAQGFATIGAIGFEGRWDYGAIGSVTNLAARLCAEAAPGQILASKRIVALTDEVATAEPVGNLMLKGFHRPVPTYALAGRRAGPVDRMTPARRASDPRPASTGT